MQIGQDEADAFREIFIVGRGQDMRSQRDLHRVIRFGQCHGGIRNQDIPFCVNTHIDVGITVALIGDGIEVGHQVWTGIFG